MKNHLFTKGPMPPEYLEMLLCERFGWTIDELNNTDGEKIKQFIAMWEVETEMANKERTNA